MKGIFKSSFMSGRNDLPLIALLLTILCVLVLPIPVVVMDMLLSLNLTLAVMVLMVAVYLKKPLEFSTFPSVILLFTAFRIALSVASTRLILLEADAGDIIRTFGEFVVQGNVVVGMVIFLIITTVQFLVVTKGAERIAEVSARFTLDAMPGKQMSIEADIRNGDVNKDDGRQQRDDLSKESQFFGAMDGAMKFVKGDAIAGLIIILINLIGGISIGIAQKGLSFGEAAQIYSLLTIGDGLVAQIPALFIAICSGVVVTRVTSETSSDLGTDIVKQLTFSSRGLWASAGIVALIGFLPGFPTMMFLALAAGLAAITMISARRARQRAEEKEESISVEYIDSMPHLSKAGERIVLRVNDADFEDYDWERFVALRDAALGVFRKDFGFELTSFGVLPDSECTRGRARIEFDEVPVAYLSSWPKQLFCHGDEKVVSMVTGQRRMSKSPLPYGTGYWVSADLEEKLSRANVGNYTAEEALQRSCEHFALANLDELIGEDHVLAFLKSRSDAEAEQVSLIAETIDEAALHEVIRRLMVDMTPLVPRYSVFGAIVDWSKRETDPVLLTEYTRQALRRQICNSISKGENEVATYLVDSRLDKAIRDAIQVTDVGGYLALDVTTSTRVVHAFTRIHEKTAHGSTKPAIVAANDVRRFLRRFLTRNNILLPVISQQELCADFTYRPLGVARLSDP